MSCSVILNAQNKKTVLLKPDRVFDGTEMHQNWVVLVKDSSILFVGESKNIPNLKIDTSILLPNQTLLPGLIEGH